MNDLNNKTNKYNIEVGERIRMSRVRKKLSMKQLGNLVNLHESTISRYEKGDIKALDMGKMKEFAEALSVPPEYLLCWDDIDRSKPIDNSNIVFSPTYGGYKVCVNDELEKMQERWFNEIGAVVFTDKEIDELITFAKFLLSKRKGE